MNGPPGAEDRGMHDDPRGYTIAIAPVDHLASPRPFRLVYPCDTARDQLVRYFAWGYLSRREVLSRLAQLEPGTTVPHHVAA